MKYFDTFNSINELKRQFRNLSLEYHPDRGGNEATFKEMINEYRELLEQALKGQFEQERVDAEMDIDEMMREVIDQIIHLEGITLEIIGSWLWVTGETYPVRQVLKDAGLKFAGKKKAWYWKSYKYRKKSKKHYSMDDLRNSFNSQTLDKKRVRALKN